MVRDTLRAVPASKSKLMPTITRMTAEHVGAREKELIALLQDAVESGASIGFLPPLVAEAAAAYWREIAQDVAREKRILLAAFEDSRLAGSVQLELASKPNARHRAEVQKLLVHRSFRGRGIGRALMGAVEDAARNAGRTLLVLDTLRGHVAEQLYHKLGYIEAGGIPNFARIPDGSLAETVIFYRMLLEDL